MKPAMQRILIGLVVGLATAGIVNTWTIISDNNQTAVRIEQHVKDISTDFDRFVDLRYQSDIDAIESRMANYEMRLDRLNDKGGD